MSDYMLEEGARAAATMLQSVMPRTRYAEPTERPIAELGLTAREVREYSLTRELRRMAFDPHGKSFERELSDDIAKRLRGLPIVVGGSDPRDRLIGGLLVPYEVQTRAMSTQPGSKGGYAVGTQAIGVIDAVRARSVCVRMGARQLPGLIGNLVAPRETATVSVTWQAGDGTSISAGDQTLGALSMTPKTCIAITDVSEQLLRQTSPAADSFMAVDIGNAVAIAVDNAAINGTGGAQPHGIVNYAGIASGQDASAATWAKLLAFSQTAGTANALRGNPGFLANTAGASALMGKQRFSGTDSPLWVGNILDGTITGLPAMSSEQVASGNLIFGSFDELVIGDWGVLELAVDRSGTRFNTAQVGIRALWLVDVMLRFPQSFVVSTNLS